MTSTMDRAHGRWPQILAQLGVDTKFLRKAKGPCPVCGGKDRFRFDDRGEGWFYCNQCGPGTGIVLLRRLNGWDFKTACDKIDRIIGTDWCPPPPSKPDRTDAAKRAAIERLFDGASDDRIVADWLRSRDLAVSSPVLFGRRACASFEEGKLVGHLPAVLDPIQQPAGQ